MTETDPLFVTVSQFEAIERAIIDGHLRDRIDRFLVTERLPIAIKPKPAIPAYERFRLRGRP